MMLIWKRFMIWIQKFHPSEQELFEECMKYMDDLESHVSPDNLEVDQ